MNTEEMVTIPSKESIKWPIQLIVLLTEAQNVLGGIKVTQVEEAVDEESQWKSAMMCT